MVRCLECLRELPYYCICPDGRVDKLRRYVEQALRELKLLEAIMVEDYSPVIHVTFTDSSGRVVWEFTYNAIVEFIDRFQCRLTVPNIPTTPNTTFSAVLMGVDGKPLSKFKFKIGSSETLNLSWTIGVPRGRAYEH